MGISIESTHLENVLLIRPSIFEDHRGINAELYNIEEYKRNNINIRFVRDNISVSVKNVLRGMHYDNKTWKLIQCMYGRIYLVVANLLKDSNEYLKWKSFILSDNNRIQILVPPGFANGHLVLSESCIFHYKMSEYYDAENEMVLRWNDPKINIFWPVKNPVLSHKDSSAEYLL